MDSKDALPPFVSFSPSISMSISNGQGEEEGNLDVPCVMMGFMTGLDAAMHAEVRVVKVTDPPLFPVEWLVGNGTGSLVAMAGRKGVTVSLLPGPGVAASLNPSSSAASSSRQVQLVRSMRIGEASYGWSRVPGVTSVCEVEVRCVKWHPGSPNDAHLVILSSDNYIRFFSMRDPLVPVQAVLIGSASPASLYPYSFHASVQASFGEIPVALDFGPPLPQGGSRPDVVRWPAFILRGDGEVYFLVTSVVDDRVEKSQVEGPLRMHPQAEDNYGSEAVEILCLRTTPPLVVLALRNGTILHCVLLRHQRDQEDEEEGDEDGSQSSESLEERPPVGPGGARMSLYVYETLDLAYSLMRDNAPKDDGDEEKEGEKEKEMFLMGDPGCSYRYHVGHVGGVHSVIIPAVSEFLRFATTPAEGEEGKLVEAESVVEHLVCTRLKPGGDDLSRGSEVWGLGVLPPSSAPGPALVALLHSGEALVLPLRRVHLLPPRFPLLSSTSSDFSAASKSEPFDAYIGRILQKSETQPLLKIPKDSKVSPQDQLKLVQHVTKVLRREYIHKLLIAKEEIEKRVEILKSQKEHQLSELERLNQTRTRLEKQGEALGLRLQEASNKQELLYSRIEKLLEKVQGGLPPMLSEPEEAALEELNLTHDQAEQLEKLLLHLKSRLALTQPGKKKKIMSPRAKREDAISVRQMDSIHSTLHQESGEIGELIRQVNNLKNDLASA
ncbi:unnamed protein product [Darwinula stevensoni]|uniref:Nuclear pore complex protein Nup88 n=1 Tax=Darwinula stevensoni TaxID=69355 RepID=A0A7R9A8I2_9CRUS|nr:unnamed protein product [Darwinula stevensoni]CAG0896497.1 unnamed protein product [Darwinula stevensoni]